MKVAIVAITRNGARLGTELKKGLPQGELFVIDRHAPEGAHPFSEGVKELVLRLWSSYDGFVFLTAAGIAVRSVAPLLVSKDRDPAVVAIDDAGRFSISLVSGHLGGANLLAETCAKITGGIPVVTTATDSNGIPSFDMIAKDNGWAIEDLSMVKHLNALVLEGEEVAVFDPTGKVAQRFEGKGNLSFSEDPGGAFPPGPSGFVVVTDRVLTAATAQPVLVLRPKKLVLGIGCNRGTACAELEDVVGGYLEKLRLSLKGVRAIATSRAKDDEKGLLQFAAANRLPLIFFDSDELNSVPAPSPPSAHAMTAIGVRGVAEPAALLASGGTLILEKVKSGNVTLAIAESH